MILLRLVILVMYHILFFHRVVHISRVVVGAISYSLSSFSFISVHSAGHSNRRRTSWMD